MAAMEVHQLAVYGLISDETFHKAKCCAEDLHKQEPNVVPEPEIRAFLEFEWSLFIEAKKQELRGEAWVFDDQAITFVNGQMLGGPEALLAWARDAHKYMDFRSEPLYATLAEQAYKDHLNSNKHEYVYLDISIGDEPAGRLLVQLFSDRVPKTCENFRCLCTGEKGAAQGTEYKLHYVGTQFHRIVRNGWIQGGDIWHGRGDGGESIYGPTFEDENFSVKHVRRGMLGMANKGRHTNQSQFYVTLAPASWMDTKYVAFGQIIEGTETLKMMEGQECINERPNKDIRISASGICDFPF